MRINIMSEKVPLTETKDEKHSMKARKNIQKENCILERSIRGKTWMQNQFSVRCVRVKTRKKKILVCSADERGCLNIQ